MTGQLWKRVRKLVAPRTNSQSTTARQNKVSPGLPCKLSSYPLIFADVPISQTQPEARDMGGPLDGLSGSGGSQSQLEKGAE
jgi:hypothetical protein